MLARTLSIVAAFAAGCASSPETQRQPPPVNAPPEARPGPARDQEATLRLRRSIDRAVGFLYEDQLPHGEFKTYVSSARDLLAGAREDPSPFITTFVVYALLGVADERVESITSKAILFLQSEQRADGSWNVYTSRNAKRWLGPPDDADDTACASMALLMRNASFRENAHLFEQHRNDEGVVNTWFSDRESYSEYDCEVNSNVLSYLALNGTSDPAICRFVRESILGARYECCSYCEARGSGINISPLFYVVSRALVHGNGCLAPAAEPMISQIVSEGQGDRGSETVLDTALNVATLIRLRYSGGEVRRGVERLLEAQRPDGAWPRAAFYTDRDRNYYGSEALTTAIAIEGLQAYSKAL